MLSSGFEEGIVLSSFQFVGSEAAIAQFDKDAFGHFTKRAPVGSKKNVGSMILEWVTRDGIP